MVTAHQDLAANFERLKLESLRQVQHYKAKYTEYKAKMRKANQNIGVLTARVAKFDIELQAEKDVAEPGAPAGHPWAGQDQLQELLANDGLNEEIRKLLSEPNY